jgi:hypothetical protein
MISSTEMIPNPRRLDVEQPACYGGGGHGALKVLAISALSAGASTFATILNFLPLSPPIRVLPQYSSTALSLTTGLSRRALMTSSPHSAAAINRESCVLPQG